MLIISLCRFIHHHGSRVFPLLILTPAQLKADILSEAIANASMATSDVLSVSNDVDEFSDPDTPLTEKSDTNTNMLDILLNSIGEGTIIDRNPDHEAATTNSRLQCENEMYQLLLGTNFMMKMQDTNTKLYNCPLSWWKSSAQQFKFKNYQILAVKYLAIPATSAPSERIWS